MSKHDFSDEEFHARRRRVREAMDEAGIDWLIVFHPVSIHWLTGSDAKSYQEFQCLLISTQPGPIIVLTREGELNEFVDDALVDEVVTWGGGGIEDPVVAFERLADVHGLRDCRVAMEVPAYYLHPHHFVRITRFLGPALVSEQTDLIDNLKLVKSPTELNYVRQAAGIADSAMEVFVRELLPGRSEAQVAGKVCNALLATGGGLAASPINLVSGERSGFSHGAPTDRQLRAGDFGSVEYGATRKRYTSTIGRQFCIGEPTPRMRELYEIVRAASDACIAAIGDGVPATVPHEAARAVIAGAGLERYRVHTTGYGLAPGFPPTWGEPIHMIGESTYILRSGMVMTVEPPVFIGEERLGARLIDNVVVKEDGAELLSRFSRDLIVVE